ncbi:MAG: family 10 glycosylhydrolase [Candidatus Anammoximicrobium sp.]|nr:family 10 glycosylhydrolase [Candidatus Anammoximicrobium sp.]
MHPTRTTWLCGCIVALAALHAAGAELAEHRGIWLHPDQFKTPEAAEMWIERIAAARLNAIYPLVWHRGGTAWFRSELSPLAGDVADGFDPLGHLIKLAHARGIAVHAWFVNGSYGQTRTDRGVFAQHPEWQLQGGGDPWYDLGRPAVRDFQRDVMIECLRNYELDGLHFDYIRYSGIQICYCDHCQQEFAAKYGFRPLRGEEDRFPILVETGGNPLDKPTTAQVLATFDDGKPAITVNRLGSGEAVLLNWGAARSGSPAVDKFVRQTLTRFGATAKNTLQLDTTQTRAKYRPETQTQTAQWLRTLGFPTRLIDETELAKTPDRGTLILRGQYYIAEDTAQQLEDFVRAGGHCLFIDGPVFAIKQPPLQRVIGLKSTAAFFSGGKVVSPAPGQDVLEAGPPLDVNEARQRMAKWVEYRTWTVSELVRSVSRDAKALKPDAWISAAVFYVKDSADRVCQDWYGWLREGSIDYVLPMAYTEDNGVLAKAFAEWKDADPGGERIIPGLSIYSRQDGRAVPRDLALVRSQLDLCRAHATHGVQFFSLAFLNEALIEALAQGPFATPARTWYPAKRAVPNDAP